MKLPVKLIFTILICIIGSNSYSQSHKAYNTIHKTYKTSGIWGKWNETRQFQVKVKVASTKDKFPQIVEIMDFYTNATFIVHINPISIYKLDKASYAGNISSYKYRPYSNDDVMIDVYAKTPNVYFTKVKNNKFHIWFDWGEFGLGYGSRSSK